MTRLLTIPFAQGQDESYASQELPDGPLREATNVRQRRLHSFGVRPDYPALSMTEPSGTMVPYALYSLNGRLFAAGDRQALGVPTDLFEYSPHNANAWIGTIPIGSAGRLIAAASDLRNVGQPPDGADPVTSSSVAAVNGLVCMTWSSSVGSAVHIFNPLTDTTLVFALLATELNTVVVVANNSFWVIGVGTGTHDLEGYRFDTTTDTALQAPVTLYTGTVTNNTFDAVSVSAAPVIQFVTVVLDGTATVVRRWNEAGVQQLTFAGPSGAIDSLAIEAEALGSNNLSVASHILGADVVLQTYNLTTGASIVGPTNVFGQTTIGGITLTRKRSNTSTKGQVFTEKSGLIVLRADINFATHVRSLSSFAGYKLTGKPSAPLATSLDGCIQPLTANVDNQMLLFSAQGASPSPSVLCTIDQGIQVDGANGRSGGVCRDISTGKFYWARIIEGTDGQAIPACTEFNIDSLLPRQACQIGNELFMTGGQPGIMDGRQLVEQGFNETPHFSGPLVAGTGGNLAPGASYDYCFIWRWTDSQSLEAKSRVSEIASVTLTTAQNSVTANCYTPHTLRRNSSTASTPTVSLYRINVDLETTIATIVGDRSFSTVPFVAGEANGKTFQISVDGGGTQTVTFATPASVTDLVIAINAQTTGLTATTDGGAIVLTDDLAGSAGSLGVVGGTSTLAGPGYLGFAPGTNDSGTTTFVKGTVFAKVASQVVTAATPFGDHIAILDTMDDTTILSQEPLYTNADHGALSGILEHESAQPCRFCCTVGSRVLIGGLPDPFEVAISKQLFPAEGLAFSSAAAFRGRVEGSVTGVASLDGIPVVFTLEAIYLFLGPQADDNGLGGQLGPPTQLPAEGGLSNANSIQSTSMGVFYQARNDKLMLIPRGGGAPIWVGKLMQDTLTLFPNITGCAYVDVDNTIAFTAQNLAGTASVVIVFDMLLKQWYLDTFSSAQVIKSAAAHAGLLAYIDGAAVRMQATSLIPAAFIPVTCKTGSINPFGYSAWGRLPSFYVESVFRGNCKLRCRISYDEGVTFTTLKVHTYLTADGHVPGDQLVTPWWPARAKVSAFVLAFDVLPDNSSTASEGLQLQHYTLELDGARPSKVRTSAAQRT